MNCLKCGRTVAEGELLCPACNNQQPQAAQQAEPKIHVHTHAFVHHKAAPPAAPESKAKKLPDEKKLRWLYIWLAIFSIGCLLCFCAAALQTMRLQQALVDLGTAQSQQEADAAVVKDLQEKLDSTKSLLNDTEEALAKKDSVIATYEEQTQTAAASLP